jgi:hypothetical protein
METSFVLKVNNAEHRLSLPTRWVLEAEKKLGMSLLAAMESVDRTSVIAVVLWASMQKLDHGMTYDKTLDLMDEMISNGCEFGGTVYSDFAVTTRTKLYTQLMAPSGFFTKEQSAEIVQKMTEQDTEA